MLNATRPIPVPTPSPTQTAVDRQASSMWDEVTTFFSHHSFGLSAGVVIIIVVFFVIALMLSD